VFCIERLFYYLNAKKYKQTIQSVINPTPIYAGGLSLVLIAPIIYINPKANDNKLTRVNKRAIALAIVC